MSKKILMAHPLYLTAEERKLFTALPSTLKEGWEIKEEKGKYKDNPTDQRLRMQMLHIPAGKLRSIAEQASKVDSEKAFAAFAAKADLGVLSDEELLDVYFAIGPAMLGQIILAMIRNAKSDQDINFFAPLCGFRHVVLESYDAISSRK